MLLIGPFSQSAVFLIHLFKNARPEYLLMYYPFNKFYSRFNNDNYPPRRVLCILIAIKFKTVFLKKFV